jgi:hypothetical protein
MTIGVEKERQPHFLYCEQLRELVIVCRRVENPPAIIAASDHLVQTTLDLSRCFPSHGGRMVLLENDCVKLPSRKSLYLTSYCSLTDKGFRSAALMFASG